MNKLLNNVNKSLKPLDDIMNSILKNERFHLSIKIFLVLYAGLAAPKLPENVLTILNHTISRILFVFLIIYLTTKDSTLAILFSIAFIITIEYANKFKALKNLKLFQKKKEEIKRQIINEKQMKNLETPKPIELNENLNLDKQENFEEQDRYHNMNCDSLDEHCSTNLDNFKEEGNGIVDYEPEDKEFLYYNNNSNEKEVIDNNNEDEPVEDEHSENNLKSNEVIENFEDQSNENLVDDPENLDKLFNQHDNLLGNSEEKSSNPEDNLVSGYTNNIVNYRNL